MAYNLQRLIENAPKEIEGHFVRKIAAKGELILHPVEKNNRLYFLLSGETDVYKERENGTSVSFNTYGPGEIFGELELFNDEVTTASIAAKTPCELLILDKEYVFYWMKRDFEFTQFICKKLACDIKSLTDNLFGMKPLPLRYRFLNVVHSRYRMDSIERLTKGDLCRYLGTDIRCINRILKEYSERGILKYANKQFAIVDKNGLNEELRRWKKQLQI